jgi:thiosulfate/3-mercaptopyruvate sulfurtransferase
MYTTLIEPAQLAAHMDDENWAVLDCRFDLGKPEWGADVYAQGHIPDALYAHLDRDLSGPVTAVSGRHPLPSAEAFATTAARWGIDQSVQVVAYDQGNAAYAARLWWLLRWMGHGAVAVLNGGFTAWQQERLPVSTQASVRKPRQSGVRVDGENRAAVVSSVEIEKLRESGQLVNGVRALIDARGADRFAGRNETLDPVAGHIPGARNRPFLQNLDAEGRFLPAATLRAQWLQLLGGTAPAAAVAMCGSGVTACHNLLALEIAGLPGAQLYAGSWSEWIRDAARPIEAAHSSS